MASSGSVGTLSWSAKLDSNEFKKGVRKVKKQMKEAQKSVTESLKVISSGFAIATGAVVGMTGALGAMTKQTAESVKEIENLSRVADTTFNEFIKMSEGAKKYGVEQDKLADILKDTKDRVGDFLATGGGPMKDFFEQIAPKVGITADAFRDLSGKDALQLFYTSLEKANLSQAEMTFYLEAVASDLTLLQPLLADNGKLLKQFGKEAEQAGLLLPDDKIQDLKDSMAGFDRLSQRLTGSIRSISAELAPTFTAITEDINKVLDDNEIGVKMLFESIGIYFQNAMDGIKYTFEQAGIIAGFESWEDAFLKTSFFIQNSFNYLMLYMKTSLEKVLSTISYPFRVFIAGIVKGVELIFRLVRKLVSLVSDETNELDRQIQELNDTVVAYDVTSLTGAFDGVLTDSINEELEQSKKEFDKTLDELKKKRKEDKQNQKDTIRDAKSGGGLFSSMFDNINKGFDAIKQGVDFLNKPNKHFKEGQEAGTLKVEVDASSVNNILATAGSVEEFNLMSAQQKEEINIAKAQLKQLQKLNRNKTESAGL